MAKYDSLVKIRGSIDDLVFYQLNGVNVVRKKSGFNTQDFKSKESYKKVRENSSEFGHCSKTGKMIREALATYLKENGDKYLYQKFAKLMTEIKDLDTTHPKGQRTVDEGLKSESAQQLLKNFKFGEIENVQRGVLKNDGLFSTALQLLSKTEAEDIEMITLFPDYKNYITVTKSQTLSIRARQTVYEFEKYEETAASLLYFAVLKKGEKILKMGFV